MEHIVQFAISLDDKTIQKRLEENAYDDICTKLVEEAKKKLPKDYGYNRGVDWMLIANNAIKNFIEENKDEILESASTKIKDSFVRTKAYKEKMKEAMDEA